MTFKLDTDILKYIRFKSSNESAHLRHFLRILTSAHLRHFLRILTSQGWVITQRNYLELPGLGQLRNVITWNYLDCYVITWNYLDCYLDYLEVIWITWIVTGITWKLPGYAYVHPIVCYISKSDVILQELNSTITILSTDVITYCL